MPTTKRASRSRSLTKTLFASGLQCAKRLYQDYHEPQKVPELSADRRLMAEMGEHIVSLAQRGFPNGHVVEAAALGAAAKETKSLLAGAEKNTAVFGAAFEFEDLEVHTDIVVGSQRDGINIYEVKSGTKVKPRHLRDLAFQIYVTEKTGLSVLSVNVLHLNPNYRHAGGEDYPVHTLFKHVDVTAKVRKHLERVPQQLDVLRQALSDPKTQDIPTGTQCKRPFACPYLEGCTDEGPEHPLVALPDLTREQESAFRDAGIDTLTEIDPQTESLSLLQRRVLRSLREGSTVVEQFVCDELRDIDYPVHFVECLGSLNVLPKLPGTRPWQQLPFAWSAHHLHEDGTVHQTNFVSDGKDDPRGQFVATLAAATEGLGTLVCFGHDADSRLRELLDTVPEQKSKLRTLINMPILELQHLIHAGVYHPDFGGTFELDRSHAVLVKPQDAPELEIATPTEASAAFERMLNSRSRATTRTKLTRQIGELVTWRSQCLLDIYRQLLEP